MKIGFVYHSNFKTIQAENKITITTAKVTSEAGKEAESLTLS